MRLYKLTGEGGTACHGGSGAWYLPTDGGPGAWMPRVEPVPCESGYHVVRARDLLRWLSPVVREVYEAEVRGKVVDGHDKLCAESARLVRRLRWDERTARLFAADCAAHVLHAYEEQHPGEDRPRAAIETARRYARGEAGRRELRAARDAAWAAARAAGRAAARAAAWAAERRWQTRRLVQYLDGRVRHDTPLPPRVS